MLHLYLTRLLSSFYTRKCLQVPIEQAQASDVLFLFNDVLNTSLPCLIFALAVKLFHPSAAASPGKYSLSLQTREIALFLHFCLQLQHSNYRMELRS